MKVSELRYLANEFLYLGMVANPAMLAHVAPASGQSWSYQSRVSFQNISDWSLVKMCVVKDYSWPKLQVPDDHSVAVMNVYVLSPTSPPSDGFQSINGTLCAEGHAKTKPLAV